MQILMEKMNITSFFLLFYGAEHLATPPQRLKLSQHFNHCSIKKRCIKLQATITTVHVITLAVCVKPTKPVVKLTTNKV